MRTILSLIAVALILNHACGCATNPSAGHTLPDNAEVFRLCQADQADRAGDQIDWAVVNPCNSPTNWP